MIDMIARQQEAAENEEPEVVVDDRQSSFF